MGYIYNHSTGGSCIFCYSHSSYFAEVPRENISKNVVNPEYIEYVEKWGEPHNGKAESLPILIEPTNNQKGDNYEKNSF